MLESTDVEKALYVMLSGVTSGYGMGFNRAALFIWDPDRERFVGSKAIGPADEAEAHRIWEAIEFEDKTIEHLIEDYANHHFDTRFQQFVQGIELAVGPDREDEVALAKGDKPPLVFRRFPPLNPSLRELGVAPEFVLAVIRPHGKLMGLIVADNLYSRSPITQEQQITFNFFTGQTALVWENLLLLERVEMLARYDGLTGVFNRREFEERFECERARSLRSQTPCSVMILDLDYFKQINDQQGHKAGDDVLRRIGALLKRSVRAYDVAARYGGDEFVLLLPSTNRDQMVAVAKQLADAARSSEISMSIGGASWPEDTQDPNTLLQSADENLYRAKAAGRKRYAFSGGSPVEY